MRVAVCCLALLAGILPARGAAEGESARLSIVVLPTIQYAQSEIWALIPAARDPTARGVDQVVRGQEVHILVLATRWAIDADGTAEVSYDVSFTRPDGTAGNSKAGLHLIPRGPAKDSRYVRKAVDMLRFIATSDDPLGEWRVKVVATDRVGGRQVQQEQSFKVVGDDALEVPVPPDIDQARWLMNYHNEPAPHQLLAMIRLFAEHPPAGSGAQADEDNGPWLGFFEQVLSDNPWLLPPLVARLAKATGRERALLSVLLAYAKRDDPAFAGSLPDALRDSINTHRLESWPVPTAEPLRGAQLDVLWGRFFASGRYEPVRALVAVLAYHPFKDALNDYKRRTNKPAQPPVEVRKSAVFGAAVWSLRSNIQQDQLVRDYCEGILLRKELPKAEQAWLAQIYQNAVASAGTRPNPASTPGRGGG